MQIIGMGRAKVAKYLSLNDRELRGCSPGFANTVKRLRVRKLRREGKRLDKNGGDS